MAAVIIGVAVLVTLALPLFGLRLGFSDEGNYPSDTTTRKAYDLLAEGFGPGFNGALILASEVPRARIRPHSRPCPMPSRPTRVSTG